MVNCKVDMQNQVLDIELNGNIGTITADTACLLKAMYNSLFNKNPKYASFFHDMLKLMLSDDFFKEPKTEEEVDEQLEDFERRMSEKFKVN